MVPRLVRAVCHAARWAMGSVSGSTMCTSVIGDSTARTHARRIRVRRRGERSRGCAGSAVGASPISSEDGWTGSEQTFMRLLGPGTQVKASGLHGATALLAILPKRGDSSQGIEHTVSWPPVVITPRDHLLRPTRQLALKRQTAPKPLSRRSRTICRTRRWCRPCRGISRPSRRGHGLRSGRHRTGRPASFSKGCSEC